MSETEQESVTTEATTEPKEAEKFDKLSNRDAAAKAIEQHGMPRESTREEPIKESVTPTAKEVKKELSEDVEPPSEFNAAGKKAWKEKDIAGIQKEYRRLHDARTQELGRLQTEAKKAREEGQTWRQLGDRVKPYIEARGKQGVAPEVAMMEALDLLDAFKKSSRAEIKAELKKVGIDMDAPDDPAVSAAKVPDEIKSEITGLRSTVESLIKDKEAQKVHQLAGLFDSVFQKMGTEKSRTGEAVYPDLQDSTEEGISFAKRLGSFAFNPEFQRGVMRRFPGADFERVVREAYTAAGGRVSGDAVKVSQSNQQEIEKKRRAAAASAGRPASTKDGSSLIGKLSNRAALIQAYRDHQEH